MVQRCCVGAVAFLLTVVAVYAAEKSDEKWNDGWFAGTPEEIYAKWKQTSIDFPRDAQKPHTEGFAAERFPAPPKAGVHPRVFINPEQRSDLLQRITQTKSGQINFEVIKTFTDKERKPDSVASKFADKLIGKELDLEQYRRSPDNDKRTLGLYLMYDAYRCWVEDDTANGALVAKKLAAYSDYVLQDLKDNPPGQSKDIHPALLKHGNPGGVEFTSRNWQGNIQMRVQHMNLALAYDFGFNFMSEAQQDVIRAMIAAATYDGQHTGMALYTKNAHNWHVFHCHLGIAALAIEGEEGYDERVTYWTIENLKTYFSYGLYESGAPNERQGKGTMNPTFLAAYQKRGHNMLTMPNVYNSVAGFEMNMMEPWGTAMIYGAWGGSGGSFSKWLSNNVVIKYAFPDDPVIDFVWRRSVGDDYEGLKNVSKVSFHYANYEGMLIQSLFLTDYDSDGNTWQEDYAALQKPLDWFCPQRALMISRSDHSDQATQLYLHCQQFYSAHPRFARGNIQFNGLGRPWTYYTRVADAGGPLGSVNNAQHYAVVTIDDVGTGYEPCPVTRYASGDTASFVTADNKFGFSWGGVDKDKSDVTFVRYKRKYKEWMPLYKPAFDCPGLEQTGDNMAGWKVAGEFSRGTWSPRFPVQRAFRTAGLVRGSRTGILPVQGEHEGTGKMPVLRENRSYALIIDDYQVDEYKHLYKWHLPLQPDLYLESQTADSIIIAEKEGDRRLLVRLIDVKGGDGTQAYYETGAGFGWSARVFERWHENRLVIPSYSIAPDFKIMLYPFRKGGELPKTTLSGNSMTIAWPDQKDVYELGRSPGGATTFTLKRRGSPPLELGDPVVVKEYIASKGGE
jgi:hypothetical protein